MSLANLPFSDNKTVGWLGNFHGMAIKTVIRILLSKYGYLSVEMQQAFEHDSEGAEETTETTAVEVKQFDVSDVSYEEVAHTDNNTASAGTQKADPGF